MAKKEVDFSALQAYLPANSFDAVLQYILQHKVHLTLTRRRSTVLGDYRHAHADRTHRISVNSDLNKYAFLITLLHELAHLITFEKFGHRVQPHGNEWKTSFSQILREFTGKNIFPADIEKALTHSIKDPAASSCADEKLLRVLKKYDTRAAGIFFVEELARGEKFQTRDGRIFERGDKIRKRYKCPEPATGRWFLFSPVYEVSKYSG